ncbi:hypothetical protein Syun_026380 [Stephania yunnanensis]|uniref:Uncharacterized protein n=1 Tax=Stephania yunnanensis TaxID=152371 RepID=A0AAP0EW31_9MAGN
MGCDFDEARRHDGLLAKKTKGVDHGYVCVLQMDFGVEISIDGHGELLSGVVDISQLSVRLRHLSGSVDIS